MNHYYVKWLILSTCTNIALVVSACILWSEFKLEQIATISFWVGAITTIVGAISAGLLSSTVNKYQGQSVAIMSTLRHINPDNNQIESSIKKQFPKLKLGLSIATPGIVLMLVSFMLLKE